MISLKGYKVTEKLKERRKSIIFKGHRESDKTNVIIKWVEEGRGFWSQEVIKKEFQISELVASHGVVKVYALEHNSEGFALVTEDFGGASLQDIIKDSRLGLKTFLNVAIQMSQALAHIHAMNVIHKDINPSNIICNTSAADWNVKITDFGISTLLSREEQSIVSPDKLEGTLAYISPEQTGRMNRSIDYRTDIYSLGATFYELLTGRQPLEAADAVGWVHQHIAVPPQAPLSLDANIPETLSNITLKMLAKNAEDRYQSASGIKADLQECLRMLETEGVIGKFEIAQKDVSSIFQIPQKLYGRESEIKKLLNAFKIAAKEGTSEMLLVGGYSGVGKSSLVQEIHKPIVEQRGYFISGKYDQFKRNLPYSAIILAMQSLVSQIITEDELKLAAWKDKLLDALGSNAQVMIETVQEIELIMGKQPPVPELGPSETQIRFNNTFLNFLNVFADQTHPLVLFLDDLQWADAASLNLVKTMMSDPDTKHLLLICAYRDNEVDAHHPFIVTVEEIRKGSALVEELILQPLEQKHVNHLTADTLLSQEERILPLSQLVMEKTNGNPFFVNMFLKTLHQEGLIFFDITSGAWEWKLARIQSRAGTDNVIDLMLNKVKKLSPETQFALRIGAAISNRFALGTLALICETPLITMARRLLEAVDQGYLIPLGDAQTLLVGLKDEKKSAAIITLLENANFRFMHDRVQGAAYALIEEEDRPGVHLKIGRLLLKNTPEEKFEDLVFDIVEQLSKGAALITDPAEIKNLVELCLECGKRAKAAVAYGAAVKYLGLGQSLLGHAGWQEQYQLTYNIHLELAECSYLNGQYKDSESLIQTTLKNAESPLEKSYILKIRLHQHTLEAKPVDALEVGREILQLLDIKIPPLDDAEALSAGFQKELEFYNQHMQEREIPELYELPSLSRPEGIMIQDIIASLLDSSAIANPGFLGYIFYKGLNFIIEHGLTDSSASVLAGTSLACAAFLGDYSASYQLGALALKLNNHRFEAPKFTCQINFLVPLAGHHWGEPLRDGIQYFDKSIESGNLNGDVTNTGYSYTVKSRHLFAAGYKLDEVLKWGNKCIDYCHKIQQPAIVELQNMTNQAVLCLKGETKSYTDFSSESWNEEKMHELFNAWSFFLGIAVFNVYKVQNACINGLYRETVELAKVSAETLPYIGGFIHVEHHSYYNAIALLALYPEQTPETQKATMKEVEEILSKMRTWAEGSPRNFRHHLLLIEAEKAAVENHDPEAVALFARSVELAHESELIQDEAFILDRAAKYAFQKGNRFLGRAYLTEAYTLFKRWGAKARARDILKQNPGLVYGESARPRRTDPDGTVSGTFSGGDTMFSTSSFIGGIDIASILKVSHSLAAEMKLSGLLDKLMEAVIENAGAQTGILLLAEDGELLVAAERDQAGKKNIMHHNLPLSDFINKGDSKIAATIVRYAARKLENVLLTDAAKDERYGNDPHILNTKPKSILCAPIIHQGKLTGLLYLENNLSVGAFTPSRLEVLGVLSSQAAISIENAHLYTNLEEKVEERTGQLVASKKEIDVIFSNVQQGLLTINPDRTISSEFSKKVIDIFERNDLGDMKFTNLFLMDKELQLKINDFLEELFTNTFMSMKLFERANPLANYHYTMASKDKKEIVKVLDFNFTRIHQTDADGNESKAVQKIMVVINDRTQEFELKKELEQKAEEQAGKVEKLYQILQLQPDVFSNFISESLTTLDQVNANLNALSSDPEKNRELLQVIFREVHTLKGNARALNLDSIGKTAHDLEDVFEELKDNPHNITQALKDKTFQAVSSLKYDIQDGNSLFEKILNMRQSLQSNSIDPMSEFEERFSNIVKKDSHELNKNVSFAFENHLPETPDAEVLRKLQSPLSHIIRNSVSHGIEPLNERINNNKPQTGQIKLKLGLKDKSLVVICTDDGAGLNTDKIIAKAKSLKLFPTDVLDNMSKPEIYRLIFSSGLSTNDNVSNIAGRGVGMDAVKADLKALNATLSINTKPGLYTRFTIKIPMN